MSLHDKIADINDDDDGDICRICRNSGEINNPLSYPCACKGSIKFVHQNCLLQWLNHTNSPRCEVCKHAFAFSPVYAADAPSRLPFREFVLGIGEKTCHVLKFLLHFSFVLSVWLFIIPFTTFWICRLAFVRSFSEVSHVFLDHMSLNGILVDWLHGFMTFALSTYIVFIHLRTTTLRIAQRLLTELAVQILQNGEIEGEGGRNWVRAVRRLVGQGNRILAAVGIVGGVGGAQVIVLAGQNVAAQLVIRLVRLVLNNVPINELFGMQGPYSHFAETAFTVLASNAVFLAVVIFVPFSMGRLILHCSTWLVASATNPILSTVDAMVSMNASAMNLSPSNISTALASDILKGVTTTSRFSDLTTLAVGYMFIFLYFGIVAFIKYTRRESLTMERFQGIALILEAITSLSQKFFACMRYSMTAIKVVFLSAITLEGFPLMCGWWLDVCTVKMFGTSMAERIEFFSVFPFVSSLAHWAVGIFYMIQICIFVHLLRGVLRNGLLHFLPNPYDPNYDPLRDLIDDPVHKHARKLALLVAVNGILIWMLVFLPVKLAMRIAPSIFPLYISLLDPFTDMSPIILFQLCIPFAIKRFKLRTVKSVLLYWFTVVGWGLGLTDYLLPQREHIVQENHNADVGRQDRLRVQQLAQLPFLPDAPNDGSLGSKKSDVSDKYGEEENSNSMFAFRIVLLLLVAWMTLLLFNSALVIIPVSVGRLIFNAMSLLPITQAIKCNDLDAFAIGSYLIWAVMSGARYIIEEVKSQTAAVSFGQIWKWCSIALWCSVLLPIYIFVIPVLIGLHFRLLVIAPIVVPVDESPVFIHYQEWKVGLSILNMWTYMVTLDDVFPWMDESTRAIFRRLRENGFHRLQGMWVLQVIVLPLLLMLLNVLCVPYVLARGVFPVFGYSLIVNSAVYRFSWLGCLFFILLLICAIELRDWFSYLHDSIRDNRYLLGRRLHNFGGKSVERVLDHSRNLDQQQGVGIGQ